MNGGLWRFWYSVRTSYWFIPSVMAMSAILLGAVMVWVDARVGTSWAADNFGWYQSIRPSGARDVLSTIAGSMITVAGVVFSITIVAISFASGQYGPRLLTNFMSDRGNTLALGTFIATFVYCLIVLRTIRAGDDGGFVPQLAVLVGILLALCSIGVLIYFVNHVPRSIHINFVIAGIARQLMHGIDQRFPRCIGDPVDEETVTNPSQGAAIPSRPQWCVESTKTGYIQSIDAEAVLRMATKGDFLVRLHYRPGDFVARGRPLMDGWSAEELGPEEREDLADAFAVGRQRTPYADLHFLINELVEIAVRALSSGVNDPFTAVTCIDWLGASLAVLAKREMPAPARTGKDGKVHVIALPDTFETFLDSGLGQLRPYAGRDPIAARHVLRTIGIIAADCQSPEQLRALDSERREIVGIAKSSLSPESFEPVGRFDSQLAALLTQSPEEIDERQAAWLGGTA